MLRFPSSAALAALAWLLPGPCVSAAPPDRPIPDGAPRSYLEIQRDIRQVLRAESQVRTLADKGPAIYELCALHREITGDRQFATNEAYRELRRQVAGRLVRLQADLKQQLHKEKVQPRTASAAASRQAPADGVDRREAVELLADHASLLVAILPGPAQVVVDATGVEFDGSSRRRGAEGRGGAAVLGDYGQDLVDLIQKTIHPDFWDVNGGPGSIVYFSPLRCLVVRATHDVQGEVGGLIRGVRDVNP